ncbi:MAG: ribbon-helix-helix protein, CopG family [Burkholderiales bacterium]
MSNTTTIRLPAELKARVAAAAGRAGVTSHSLILEAIAQKIEQDESLADFEKTADDRYAAIIATGKSIPWSEMRSYLERRVAGKSATRPKAKKLGR